jgi:hypothetical protein
MLKRNITYIVDAISLRNRLDTRIRDTDDDIDNRGIDRYISALFLLLEEITINLNTSILNTIYDPNISIFLQLRDSVAQIRKASRR